MFGFNRMVQPGTHPLPQSIYGIKRLMAVYLAEIVMTGSYDLIPLEYLLWGAVKEKCYADKPEIIEHLKVNINYVIAEI